MIVETKQTLRQIWRRQRKGISPLRRLAAMHALATHMIERTVKCKAVLSYASFGDELSTKKLNASLASNNRLVLPRIEGEKLQLFQVNDLNTQLKENVLGIPEPDPLYCLPVSFKTLDFAIIPGLAFDSNGGRLGYGGGYFDRLLSQLSSKISCVGVGFTEQLSPNDLPMFSHDIIPSSIELF